MKTFLEWVQEIDESWVSLSGAPNFNQVFNSLIHNVDNKEQINSDKNKMAFAGVLAKAMQDPKVDKNKLETAARAYKEIFGVGFFNVANKSGQSSKDDFTTVLQQGAKRAENPIFRGR